MILFQRTLSLQGSPAEVGPWAAEVAELVGDITDLDVSVWSASFGLPVGTLSFSTRIDSLTALETASDTLLADAGYRDLILRATPWMVASPEDTLLRVVHASGPEYTRGDVGSYAEVTGSVPAAGRMRDAMAWAVDIADHHSRITHATVLFATSGYGDFGEVRWLAMYDSAADVDTAAQIIAKDEEYAASIDAAGELFQPGSAKRVLARRMV